MKILKLSFLPYFFALTLITLLAPRAWATYGYATAVNGYNPVVYYELQGGLTNSASGSNSIGTGSTYSLVDIGTAPTFGTGPSQPVYPGFPASGQALSGFSSGEVGLTNTTATAALNTALTGAGAVTLSAWINLSSIPTAEEDLIAETMSGSSGGTIGFQLEVNAGTSPTTAVVSVAGRSVSTDSKETFSCPFTPNVNQWYHLVGVLNFNASTATIYVNGVEMGTTNVTVWGSSTFQGGSGTGVGQLAVGAQYPTATSGKLFTSGAIDDVAIFPSSFGSTKAEALYQAAPPSDPQYGNWTASVIGGGGYNMAVIPSPNNTGGPGSVYYTFTNTDGISRGVLNSDGATISWTRLGLTAANVTLLGGGAIPGDVIRSLAVAPITGSPTQGANDTLLAAFNQGLYLSTNSGSAWTQVGVGSSTGFQYTGNTSYQNAGPCVAFEPQNPNNVVEATNGSTSNGIEYSTNGGSTWSTTSSLSGFPDYWFTDVFWDQSSANAGRVWACASPNGSPYTNAGLFMSTNSGKTWVTQCSAANGPGGAPPLGIIQNLTISSSNAKLYCTALGFTDIYTSTNSGSTWSTFDTGLTLPDTYAALTSTPASGGSATLICADESGNFNTRVIGTGAASKWSPISQTNLTVSYPGCQFIGTWPGNGFTTATNEFGMNSYGASVSSVTVDPTNTSHWFMTDYWGTFQSFDSGVTWAIAVSGQEITSCRNITMDPVSPNTAFLCESDNSVFISYDGGITFGNDKLLATKPATADLKAIDISEANDQNVVTIGSVDSTYDSNQVFSSTNSGSTWSTSPMTGLPTPINSEELDALAFTPNVTNGKNCFVTVQGNGVYESTNNGSSWSSFGTGLGSSPFPSNFGGSENQIVIDSSGDIVTVSGGTKAFYCPNGSTTWSHCGTLPFGVSGENIHVAVDKNASTPTFYAVADNMTATGDAFFVSTNGGSSWTQEALNYGSSAYTGAFYGITCNASEGTTGEVAIMTQGTSAMPETVVHTSNATAATPTWTDLDAGSQIPSLNCAGLEYAGNHLIVYTHGGGAFWYLLSNP